jgi:predicted nuclease of predicted toxin-antitoxin system
MRFLADMGVAIAVVEWLRARGHDATHLREQGLQRLADTDVFDKARLERVLQSSSEDLQKGAVIVVEDGRHRVRRLPVGS